MVRNVCPDKIIFKDIFQFLVSQIPITIPRGYTHNLDLDVFATPDVHLFL